MNAMFYQMNKCSLEKLWNRMIGEMLSMYLKFKFVNSNVKSGERYWNEILANEFNQSFWGEKCRRIWFNWKIKTNDNQSRSLIKNGKFFNANEYCYQNIAHKLWRCCIYPYRLANTVIRTCTNLWSVRLCKQKYEFHWP